MPGFLTIENAAVAMQCSKRTVNRMIRAGDLEYIEVGVGDRKSIRVKLPNPKTKRQPQERRGRKEYVCAILNTVQPQT